MLNKKSIYLPVIAYGGSCRAEFAMSCSGLFVKTIQNHPNLSIQSTGIFFESLVSRARNAAAAAALHYKTDYLLFIDADIAFDADDVFKLIKHDKDVVCGPYAKKYLSTQKIQHLVKHKPEVFDTNEWKSLSTDFSSEIKPSSSDLIEVDYAATGFMLIKTDVFRKIALNFPKIKYKNDIDGYSSWGDNFYNFFPAEINESSLKYESEDYGFCKLWRSIGGKIFLDTSVNLHHIGNMTYEANLKQQLQTYK